MRERRLGHYNYNSFAATQVLRRARARVSPKLNLAMSLCGSCVCNVGLWGLDTGGRHNRDGDFAFNFKRLLQHIPCQCAGSLG